MEDDLNIIDDFLDDFEHICDCAYNEEYLTTEASNKAMNLKEGWTGLRTLDVKTRYPDIVRKIEKETDKFVDRMHFYKIEGDEKQWLWDNREKAMTPHRDGYNWAGVIYLWGNTGTYYDGELVEFKKNRMIWYDAENLHMPDLTDEDRCVIVFFLIKPWRNFGV